MTKNVGDWVRLNSGGPDMLIERVDDDRVRCKWFHEDGLSQIAFFPAVCVKLIADGIRD